MITEQHMKEWRADLERWLSQANSDRTSPRMSTLLRVACQRLSALIDQTQSSRRVFGGLLEPELPALSDAEIEALRAAPGNPATARLLDSLDMARAESTGLRRELAEQQQSSGVNHLLLPERDIDTLALLLRGFRTMAPRDDLHVAWDALPIATRESWTTYAAFVASGVLRLQRERAERQPTPNPPDRCPVCLSERYTVLHVLGVTSGGSGSLLPMTAAAELNPVARACLTCGGVYFATTLPKG